MALDTNVASGSKVTLVIKDYAGSPLSFTVARLIPESVVLPGMRARKGSANVVTSSTGQSYYANPDHGMADDPSRITFQVLRTDPNNSTDQGEFTTFIALAKNVIAGTPISTWTVTSQLTGGGKVMVKLQFTFNDESGSADIATTDVEVESVEPVYINGVVADTITCKMFTEITWT